jgi:hypothetical protein
MSNNSLLEQWNSHSPKKLETPKPKPARDQTISLDLQTQVQVTRQPNQNQSQPQIYKNSATKTQSALATNSYPYFRGIRQTHPADPDDLDFYLLDGTYEIIQYQDPDFELID